MAVALAPPARDVEQRACVPCRTAAREAPPPRRSVRPSQVPLARRPIELGGARDREEQDAETLAAQLLRPSAAPVTARAGGGAGVRDAFAPRLVHEVLATAGRPLDAASRAYFQPRLGVDLATVRVHDDDLAARSARAVGAVAYTVGRHVALADGAGAGTRRRLRVLAHELAHVAQHVPGARPVLRRLVDCVSPLGCPGRDPGEVRTAARGDMAVLDFHDGDDYGALVANFAIGLADLKPNLARTLYWQHFVAQLASLPDTRWEILGFSDCAGEESRNLRLRRLRAAALAGALPPAARATIARVDAAPIGECITANEDPGRRTLNRSALIRRAGGFRSVDVEGEAIEVAVPPRPQEHAPEPAPSTDMWPHFRKPSLGSRILGGLESAASTGLDVAKSGLKTTLRGALWGGRQLVRHGKDIAVFGGKAVYGAGRQAVRTVEGLGSMALHPVRTAGGLLHAAEHPIRTLGAIASGVRARGAAILSGDPVAIGATIFDVWALSAGAGDVEEAGTLGRGAGLGEAELQRLSTLEARIEALQGTQAPAGQLIEELDAIDVTAPDAAERIRALEARVARWEGAEPGEPGLGELTGESEAARRAALGRRAEIVEANRMQGSAAEAAVEREIHSGQTIRELGSPATLRGAQVRVETPAGLRIVDFVVARPSGELVALEVKSGGAVRDAYQLACDKAMKDFGGKVLRSKVSHGLPATLKVETIVLRR